MVRPTNLVLVFCDSCAHYATSVELDRKWVEEGGPAISGTWVVGSGGIYATNAGTAEVTSYLPFGYRAHATWEVGCKLTLGGTSLVAAIRPFVLGAYGGPIIEQCYIAINTSNQLEFWRADGTLLGTSTYTVPMGVQVHLAAKIKIDNSVGGCVVRANGVPVLSVSGVDSRVDTSYSGANVLRVRTNGQGDGNYVFTDFYMAKDTDGSLLGEWLGGHRIALLYPTANSSPVEWTASAGANYDAVNDAIPDDDTTYVQFTAPSGTKEDRYVMGDIALTGSEFVLAPMPWWYFRSEVGHPGDHEMDQIIIANGTTYSATYSPQVAYTYKALVNEGLATLDWTQVLINDIEMGILAPSRAGTTYARLTQAVIEVVIGSPYTVVPPNLAAVFIDSFEHYQTDAQLKSKWGNSDYPGTGTWYIGNSPSGDGLQALTAINTEEAELTAVMSDTYRDHPTWEVGCWINAAGASGMTIPVRPFILGRTGPSPAESVQCYVQINTSRQIEFRRGDDTLLATSTYVLPLYQKIHLAAKIHIDNAAGGVRVKANGVTVLTADSLDTRTDGTYTGADFVRIRSNDTNVLPFYFEDYYITKDSDTTLAGAWLGFHRIPICRPNASASPNEWDYAGAASHHQAVGDVYADEHVSYVQITNGDGTREERYLMSDLTLPLDDEEYIALVVPWWQSHNLLGGGSAIPVTLKAIVNAITYTTLTTPETTWDFDTLSDTAFADIEWTESLVNGAQLGMVATAPAGTPGTSVLKVSQVLMEVLVGRPFALTGAGRTYGFITKAMPQVPIYAGLLEDVGNRIVDFFGSQLVEDIP